MVDTTQETKPLYLNPISEPLATEKLEEKLLTLTAKLANLKLIRRGVKEVNKAFRKKEVGLCIIAGDVSPIDVVSHIPILCEKFDVPYIYIKSREKLGEASQTKRPTSVVMLLKPKKDNKYFERFEKLGNVVRFSNPYLKQE